MRLIASGVADNVKLPVGDGFVEPLPLLLPPPQPESMRTEMNTAIEDAFGITLQKI
jgi:hypothetical protein